MYVYDTPPVDYFATLCPLHKVSWLIKPLEDEGMVGSYKEWMKFFRNSLITLKDCTNWHPRMEGFLVYVGSIPNPYEPADRFIVIKQSRSGDNGDSYVISEAEMPHLREFYVKSKNHNTIPENLELERFINEVVADSVYY